MSIDPASTPASLLFKDIRSEAIGTRPLPPSRTLPGWGCKNVGLLLHTCRDPVINGDQTKFELKDPRSGSGFERVHLVAHGLDVSGIRDCLWNWGLVMPCIDFPQVSHPSSWMSRAGRLRFLFQATRLFLQLHLPRHYVATYFRNGH